ncbi:MAG: DNA methyltransferase [Chloroflexota bacterium]
MSNARHHAEWLSLIEVSGPFLSMPVLMRVFPQGLEMVETEAARNVRLAYDEWSDNREAARPDPSIHNAWVRYVLSAGLEWLPEAIAEGPALSPDLKATIAEHGENLRPDIALRDPHTGRVVLLVQILPAGQGLEKPLKDHRWKASPATRMIELLHSTGVRLGLVTNGEQWMLVNAARGETTGLASWYAALWGEEPITLRAFKSLLGLSRFFSVAAADTLEALLIESATDQQEVTDQLGYQVRRAVEVLVQRLDGIDREQGHRLLEGVTEKRLYEGALTVMMRLVFLFSAEEREMLLLGDPLYDQYYAVSTLRAQLRDTADRHGEEILERRRDAWTRLLSTFRLVFGGAAHDRMSLPAYGGRLFDPDAYLFLEGRAPGTRWEDTPAHPLPIDNRTVLHLLEALQVLRVKVPGGGPAEPRRLSFRALDVEQIGHVYEGLLDHTAMRATEPVVSLMGRKFQEPEVDLARLEELRDKGDAALVEFLAKETGRSASAIRKDLARPIDAFELQLFRTACDNDDALLARVRPFAGLIRSDSFGYPVVINTGSVYVTQGSDRRETGTHYTPRSLTEPIVQHALDPLVYRGMADGVPPSLDTLISAREILDLKVCDMAMGSGAFLVQAVRYLSEKLVEAWRRAEEAGAGRLVVTPEGDLATGDPAEQPIPRDPDERLALARRIVCDRCIYGVDINPMAVEMAKLSLWLTTMQRDRPFTFLDHALRCGDSLLGADVRQLSRWSLEREEGEREAQFSLLAEPIRWALDESTRLRRRIEASPVLTKADADYKAALLAQADDAVSLVKLGGDLLCAAVLAPDDRERDRLRLNWGTSYSVMMTVADEQRKWPHTEAARADLQRDISALRAEADALLQGRRPFHWQLEFPEVFSQERVEPGFDAIIGNPPFLGGRRITGSLGDPYYAYVVRIVSNSTQGNSDLCSYFFLRGSEITHEGSNIGLIATNTIAQGDTREAGLDQLVSRRWVIYRAIPSREWPGGANLAVAHIWMHHGTWSSIRRLEDLDVIGITSELIVPSKVMGKPYRLISNSDKSFQGVIVLGMGFVL